MRSSSRRQPRPNWKALDILLPVLEKEGWTLPMIASDWGISLATLENHLTQEMGMPSPSKHDYAALFAEYDQRLASGESPKEIRATFDSRGINWGTFQNRRTQAKKEHQGTPVQLISTGAEYSVDTGADELFDEHTPVHIPVHMIDTGVYDSAESSADDETGLSLPPSPVQTTVQRFDTGPVQTLDTGSVQRLDRLEEEVQTLAHVVRSLADRLNHTPVQSTVQITTLPPYPKGKSVRWNLWILDSIRDELATLAAERDVSPSQLVQELLWKALRHE